ENESDKHRDIRCAKDRENKRMKKSSETPEQREMRLRRERSRKY
ncbi:2655_t:CDS:1, partial [Funneliformis mosseae]